jgi:hypothetical protein
MKKLKVLFALSVSCVALTVGAFTTACGEEQAHVHSYGDWNVKAPTCTEDGSRVRTCECGETETEVIPATGHAYSNEWTYDDTNHWHVATCEHTSEVGGKAAHSFGEWTVTKAATCTETGSREKACACGYKVTESIAATSHTYSDEWTYDDTNHWHVATCEHTTEVSGKAEHSLGEWTVTKAATCTETGSREKACACGYKVTESIAATNHTYSSEWSSDETYHWYAATCEHTTEVSGKAEHSLGEWTVTKAATCTEAGSREKACACGYKAIETIAATGHAYSDEWSSDETYHWHAATCEHTTEVGSKAEHNFENGSCTTCGYVAHLTEQEYAQLVAYYTKPMVGEVNWKDGDIEELSDWNFTLGCYGFDKSTATYKFVWGSALDCANKKGYEKSSSEEYTYYYEKDGKVYKNDVETTYTIYSELVTCYSRAGGEIVCTAFYYSTYADWKYDKDTDLYSAEFQDESDYRYTSTFKLNQDGKISELVLIRYSLSDPDNPIDNIKEIFSDYGTTRIEVPSFTPTVLTEDTDYDSLVSEKVTKEQWEAAFDVASYTNVTISNTYKSVSENGTRTSDYIWMTEEGNDEKLVYMSTGAHNEYYNCKKTADGNIYLSYNDSDWQEFEKDTDTYKVYDTYFMTYKIASQDFGAFYEKFTYNESTGAYEFYGTIGTDEITTNATFEYHDLGYYRATVKIINGKLAYVSAVRNVDKGHNEYDYAYFYDYGTTEFEVPAMKTTLTEDTDYDSLVSEKVTKEQWEAAFDVASFTNVTMSSIYENVHDDEDEPRTRNLIWMTEEGNGERNVAYYAVSGFDVSTDGIGYAKKTDDGKFYQYYNGEWNEFSEKYGNWIMSYTFLCVNFGDFFEKFTYNETIGAYEFNGTIGSDEIKSNACGEADSKLDYYHAVVKIINGKLAYVLAVRNFGEGENEYNYAYFYDYGTTKVEIPKETTYTVTEDEYNAIMDNFANIINEVTDRENPQDPTDEELADHNFTITLTMQNESSRSTIIGKFDYENKVASLDVGGGPVETCWEKDGKVYIDNEETTKSFNYQFGYYEANIISTFTYLAGKYDADNYNEETHEYSFTLSKEETKYEDIDVTMKFENGKLISVVFDMSSSQAIFTFSDYGTTTVEIPS